MADKSQPNKNVTRSKLGQAKRGDGTILARVLGKDSAQKTDVAAFQSSI